MIPEQRGDFSYSDKLSKILKHPRLRDKKYGSPNYREVLIVKTTDLHVIVYRASAMFLKSLLEKYGDRPFGDALAMWKGEKDD